MKFIAWVLLMLVTLIPVKADDEWSTYIIIEAEDEEYEWRMYNHEARDEYMMMFNEIYAAQRTMFDRNGRVMVKGINDRSFHHIKRS